MNKQFNFRLFKALVWHCAKIQGTISPETWEIIVAFCFDGTWVGGNKYMADAFVKSLKAGLTIKSVKKQFTKGPLQTIDCVEARIPIDDEELLSDEEKGKKAIENFVKKREESFKVFGLETMYKVLIVHHRDGDDYYARLFLEEQPKYEDMDLVWENGVAKLRGSKKKDPWTVKRNDGNDSGFQTCFWSKKRYDKNDALADIKVNAPFEFELDPDKIMKEYYGEEDTSETVTSDT